MRVGELGNDCNRFFNWMIVITGFLNRNDVSGDGYITVNIFKVTDLYKD